MNHQMLKTPFEIQKEIGISTKDLELLFNENNIKLLKLPDIAFNKRSKDFEKIYHLHINKRLSLNEIYRQYGYSPLYSKRVLKDRGIDHLNFVNQMK
ncbi:AraC family transcriptional regulator [Siminovitchia fortis]|uniref:AraC family transcriptional regulator n=1 Tax=Siminovitchia fortis TaxID=254758 RepID=UPI0011A68037|nr:AraC family transcriptional regulator [Siminovitchia fortis]